MTEDQEAAEREQRRERGNRLRAARELVGLRSAQALVDFLDAKGFSYGKLSKIEAGLASLSPQDALYIAQRLGLSSTFFTSPADRLGDIDLGDQVELQEAVERRRREAAASRVDPVRLSADALRGARRATGPPKADNHPGTQPEPEDRPQPRRKRG